MTEYIPTNLDYSYVKQFYGYNPWASNRGLMPVDNIAWRGGSHTGYARIPLDTPAGKALAVWLLAKRWELNPDTARVWRVGLSWCLGDGGRTIEFNRSHHSEGFSWDGVRYVKLPEIDKVNNLPLALKRLLERV